MTPGGEYVSGGYFITRRIPRPDWCDSNLLPEVLVSASTCLCPRVPDTWTFSWVSVPRKKRLEAATAFGLSGKSLDAVEKWANRALEDDVLGWPDVFQSLDATRGFAREFITSSIEIAILGLSLDRDFRSHFLDDAKPQGWGTAPCGMWQTVGRNEPPAAGGRSLGFELLNFDGCGFESWLLCNLGKAVAEGLGILPGPRGLIASPADAIKAATHCNRSDVYPDSSLWLPWLLQEYDLTETGSA